MRMLVIDDIYMIESGVARVVEGQGGHTVVGARNPADLRRLLATDHDFQLAFVDLHYGPGAPESGLAALEALGHHEIPSIIYTADGEQNRPLFMLAAFEFFPRTCTIVSKHAGDRVIRQVVDAIAHGNLPNDVAARRYRPSREGRSLLQQLVGQRDDLLLWRALAAHTKLPLIAQAAHCSPRKVSDFISQRQPLVHRFQHELLDQPFAPEPELGEKNRPLLDVCRFAQPNADFFADPDVERLITECWEKPNIRRGKGSRPAGSRRQWRRR